MLANEFESILEITDGEETLEAYTNYRPDWVIMDIKMNRMDGITATGLLKKNFPDAKVIVLTNLPYPELRNAAREAGADWYVMKESLLELHNIIKGNL
jgi:two-component system, NarL family, response regulator NreC